MSAHYDKFSLNTYSVMPYFHAHIPKDYPLNRVLQKCRAFRRLPPNLRKLSGLAKKWAIRVYSPLENDFGGIEQWYDAEGYELEPGSGRRLTDEEIDEQWVRWQDDELDKFEVKDIPIPPNGFADPDMWEEPPREEEIDLVDRSGMTETGLLGDIASRGREYTAREYGVPEEWLSSVASDEELARAILDMHGKPWPARSSSSDVSAG